MKCEAWDRRPEATIRTAERVYLSAFRDLSASRTVSGAGPCAIKPSELEAWARIQGISGPLVRDLWEVVHSVDLEWLLMRSEKSRPAKP